MNLTNKNKPTVANEDWINQREKDEKRGRDCCGPNESWTFG